MAAPIIFIRFPLRARRSDFEPGGQVHEAVPVEEQVPVAPLLDLDVVHGPGRRPIEVYRVAEVPAAVAGTLEALHRRVGRRGRLTGQRVAQTADSLCHQVRGDVGEVAGRAAQVGADQVAGIYAVGV